MLKRLSSTALAAVLALGLASGEPASAQDFTMKFGTATINEDQHQYIKFFKEELEERSGGRIEVEIYPQSQLGPIPRQIEGLQLGTVEGFIGPADFYVGLDPRFGVFATPMLFRDREHADATISDPEFAAETLALGREQGIVGIGVYVMAQHDYLGREPIRSLADFDGRRIRVNATPVEREAMARLGATASPMPLNEVMPALQRNVIDATRSALSIFVSLQYQDVSTVATRTSDTFLFPVASVSQVWLETLPEDLQQAVLEAGEAAQKRNREWAREFHATMPERWAELGGELYDLPAEDREKLAELLLPVGDAVTQDQPEIRAFLDRLRDVAAKH